MFCTIFNFQTRSRSNCGVFISHSSFDSFCFLGGLDLEKDQFENLLILDLEER